MEDYIDEKIEKRKEKSKDLSPEERGAKFTKPNRKISRRDITPKTQTQRSISRKAGRNRQRIQELEETVAIMVGKLQAVTIEVETIQGILNPPPTEEELQQFAEDVGAEPESEPIKKADREACPTCGKLFKQLKKHKCKGK